MINFPRNYCLVEPTKNLSDGQRTCDIIGKSGYSHDLLEYTRRHQTQHTKVNGDPDNLIPWLQACHLKSGAMLLLNLSYYIAVKEKNRKLNVLNELIRFIKKNRFVGLRLLVGLFDDSLACSWSYHGMAFDVFQICLLRQSRSSAHQVLLTASVINIHVFNINIF